MYLILLAVGLALSPDKRYAVISGGDGTVSIIDTSEEDPMTWSDPTIIDMSGLDEDARIISASVMSDLAIKTSDKALRIGSL